MRPPNMQASWDDNDVWSQALMIAYSQIRDYEDMELMEAQMNAGVIKKGMAH